MSRRVFSTEDRLLCQQKLQLDCDHVILSYLLWSATTCIERFGCAESAVLESRKPIKFQHYSAARDSHAFHNERCTSGQDL